MKPRANVFAIHSWDDAEQCRRMQALLRASDPDLAHYTVPPERLITGDPTTVAASLEARIQFATAVVVINSPGLHRREWSDFEMKTAVRLRKRIVVVQPDRQFNLPIPAVLDGHVYRFAGWRSDVVGRAIRGEYPYDARRFDIAESAERRLLVGVLSAGVAAVSFAVAWATARDWKALSDELSAAGVQLRWSPADTSAVVDGAIMGALAGGLLVGVLTRDMRSALFAAGAGLALGAAVGARKVYRARLLGSRELRVLTIEPA